MDLWDFVLDLYFGSVYDGIDLKLNARNAVSPRALEIADGDKRASARVAYHTICLRVKCPHRPPRRFSCLKKEGIEMHKTTLIGNLGTDPEQREVGWKKATNFTVAVNERWTDSEGENRTRTIWYRVTAWGQLGDVCAEHLHKGRKVYVEGTLISNNDTGGPRAWIREDGTPAAAYDLRAATIEFLDNTKPIAVTKETEE